MEKLCIGLHVDIKRSDRRVHSAQVSSISKRSVTVEWTENGENKAKEVDVESVFALNPHLLRANETWSNLSPTPVKLRNGGSMAVGHVRPVARESVQVPRPVCTPAKSTIGFSEVKVMQPTPTHPGIRSTIDTGRNQNRQAVSSIQSSGTLQAARKSQSTNPRESDRIVSKPPVLREAERLEKNREERRTRLAESREEKRNQMQKDPGNQKWEFSAMIKEYQSTLDFRPFRDSEVVHGHQINVCVRKRPMNKKECDLREIDIVTIPNREQLIVHEPKLKVDLTKYLENQQFRFDYAFDESCDNERVYNYTAKPLLQTIFDGGMATCFAYGQTGSGKTHTMGGDFQSGSKSQNCGNGIYVFTARDVFEMLQWPQYARLQLFVCASFFEIYSGKVFDLLNKKNKLRVLEDHRQQIQVVGLRERQVHSVDEVLELIRHGSSARTSGQTSANANSSRSHAVFQIILRATSGGYGANSRVHGKFSLVDLAGNERGADTGNSADRQTRMEGAEINKSLLALKECIRALGKKEAHLPFRQSKLTLVLKDSFVGEKSKTCMIAMVGPSMSSCEHTLNTLRYADRVKELAVGGLSDAEPVLDPGPCVVVKDESDSNLDSISEEELSDEMYSFHDAAFRLQEMDEEVVDCHRSLMDDLSKWRLMFAEMMDMRKERLDCYNLEGGITSRIVYAREVIKVLSDAADVMDNLKKKATLFYDELEQKLATCNQIA